MLAQKPFQCLAASRFAEIPFQILEKHALTPLMEGILPFWEKDVLTSRQLVSGEQHLPVKGMTLFFCIYSKKEER